MEAGFVKRGLGENIVGCRTCWRVRGAEACLELRAGRAGGLRVGGRVGG